MIKVKQADKQDLHALMNFLHHLGPETGSRFAPHAFDEGSLHYLLGSESGHAAFTATEDGGAIIGYAVVRSFYESYELDRFRGYGWTPGETTDAFYAPCVADAFQGKGIGKLLLKEATAMLQASGRTRLLLWGGVQATNERALAHYRKAGFRELGAFEWNGRNLDMTKRLAN